MELGGIQLIKYMLTRSAESFVLSWAFGFTESSKNAVFLGLWMAEATHVGAGEPDGAGCPVDIHTWHVHIINHATQAT